MKRLKIYFKIIIVGLLAITTFGFSLKANNSNKKISQSYAVDILKIDTLIIPDSIKGLSNGFKFKNFSSKELDSLFSIDENMFMPFKLNIDSLGINHYFDDNFKGFFKDYNFNSDSLRSFRNNSKLFEQMQQMMQHMFKQSESRPDSNSFYYRDQNDLNIKPKSKSKFRKL